MNPRHRWVIAVVLGFAVGAAPRMAEAKGTLFIIEAQGGFGESAYSGGGPSVGYGVSAGVTLKFTTFPVRWYLLGTVLARDTSIEGRHEGIGFEADRNELDIFFAQRTVIPVWRFVRVYFETGLGTRLMSQEVRRQEMLGTLTESSDQLLLVLGVGMQARLTEHFSIGIRGEITPLDVAPDVTAFAADLEPESNRLSLFGQFGVHF